MNVLMMVSWYTRLNKEISAGIFHYEQIMNMKEKCNVALFWPFDIEQKERCSCEIDSGVRIYRTRFKEGLKYKIQRLTDIFLAFKRINKEFKPDIIHAHVASSAGKYAIALGRLFNIPVVITEHCPLELTDINNSRSKRIIHNVYRKSKANFCVSDYLTNKLREVFPDCEFQVMYNGINIRKDVIPLDVRKDSSVNAVIVAAFYNEYVKGYHILLPALKKVLENDKNIYLHIVGDGIYKKKYEQMAYELGIQDNCKFYGQLSKEETYKIIKSMDFAISASLTESAGVFVEESMMLGKPLVVTKSGGADSLVGKDAAIIVEKNDVTALSDGIKYMIDNFYRFDSKKITEYTVEKFDMENINNKYINVYKRIIQNKKDKNEMERNIG